MTNLSGIKSISNERTILSRTVQLNKSYLLCNLNQYLYIYEEGILKALINNQELIDKFHVYDDYLLIQSFNNVSIWNYKTLINNLNTDSNYVLVCDLNHQYLIFNYVTEYFLLYNPTIYKRFLIFFQEDADTNTSSIEILNLNNPNKILHSFECQSTNYYIHNNIFFYHCTPNIITAYDLIKNQYLYDIQLSNNTSFITFSYKEIGLMVYNHNDKTLSIYDIESGNQVYFSWEGRKYEDIQWFDSSIPLFLAITKDCIFIYELGGNQIISKYRFDFNIHKYNPQSLTLSPNGNKLYIGSNEGCIFIYDLINKEYISNFQAHKDSIHSICTDDNIFVSCTESEIKYWSYTLPL